MSQRAITSVQIIHGYAQQKGIADSVLFANSDIKETQLQDNDCLIEDAQELVILQNLLNELGDPLMIGMELGQRYPITSYGIFGYALLASGTLRKAVSFGQQHLALTYIFSDITLHEGEGAAAIEVTGRVDGQLGLMLTIRDMWAVLLIMKELWPVDIPPFNIELKMPRPDIFTDALEQALKQQFHGQFIFSSSIYGFSGLNKFLDSPLPKANEVTAKICEQQCSELLKQKQNWQMVSQLVRDQILNLGLNCSMDSVASELARTSRTLHRQLKEEGTSWRRVRDDVRLGLAEEYLKQNIAMEEIAERLGYSDAANFSHAFKRWKGISPSVFRQQ